MLKSIEGTVLTHMQKSEYIGNLELSNLQQSDEFKRGDVIFKESPSFSIIILLGPFKHEGFKPFGKVSEKYLYVLTELEECDLKGTLIQDPPKIEKVVNLSKPAEIKKKKQLTYDDEEEEPQGKISMKSSHDVLNDKRLSKQSVLEVVKE